MSSTAFLPPTVHLSRPSHSGCPSTSAGAIPQRERVERYSSDKEKSWRPTFRDGLLTPPQTIMTGPALSHTHSQPASNGMAHGLVMPMYQSSTTSRATYNTGTNGDYYRSSGDGREPVSASSTGQDSGYESKRNSNASIATYLQIPSEINSSQGSLTEFAADITCLFWFESGDTLRQIEESVWSSVHLSLDTTPTMGFRKWVTTILSTTQVTRNVILLALLFVYRLKHFNPGVSGKRGSEFRLFTIALMLGNKFLDDNTYTNKTWAEVSGIAVQEIHIMEVEFLSNMRYNLFVSPEEWARWMKKLNVFYTFLDTSRSTLVDSSRNNLSLTPTHAASPYKLPSPPSPPHSLHPYGHSQNMQQQLLHPPSLPPTLPTLPASPVRTSRTEYPPSRKRSWEFSPESRPAKRMSSFSDEILTMPQSQNPSTSASSSVAGIPMHHVSAIPQPDMINRGPRLPVPRLQTSMPNGPGDGHTIQLPLPAGRAMYSSHQSNVWPQSTTPINGPSPILNIYSNPVPSLPGMQSQKFPAPTRSSPPGTGFPSWTPTSNLSPFCFLANRNSPYRPIRNVHTLLDPPPSSSLQNPSRNINFDQMRYQPLSKNPAEPRAGVVPYLHHDSWSQQPSLATTSSGYAIHP